MALISVDFGDNFIGANVTFDDDDVDVWCVFDFFVIFWALLVVFDLWITLGIGIGLQTMDAVANDDISVNININNFLTESFTS